MPKKIIQKVTGNIKKTIKISKNHEKDFKKGEYVYIEKIPGDKDE